MDFQKNCGSRAIIIGLSDCGEKVCAAGGRISTQQGNAMEIFEKSQDIEKNTKLIAKVTRSGHNSVVEHAYLNIAFQNVSAVVEQFIIEFRLASFTVKSRRYVDFSEVGYYIPEFNNNELNSIYKSHMDYLFEEYQSFLDNGIAKEDARFILPYCFRSNFICSVNAREFLHILRAMLYGRGSKYNEIKNLGHQLYEQALESIPGIMTDFDIRRPTKSDEIDLSFIIRNTVSANNDTQQLVELLSYTQNAEECVVRNAMITATQLPSSDVELLLQNKDIVSKTIASVISSSRPRPLEAVNFTFRLNGVSLSCITHFVRHRIQSIEIPPLTATNRQKYIIPQSILDNEVLLARYHEAFKRNAELYQRLKEQGVEEHLLVYYLLSGNTLDIVTTMNARELLLFFKLRTCTRAQWEIQKYAIEMLFELRKIAPTIFNLFGPSCYADGKCPEGALTCGRMIEMNEKYGIID